MNIYYAHQIFKTLKFKQDQDDVYVICPFCGCDGALKSNDYYDDNTYDGCESAKCRAEVDFDLRFSHTELIDPNTSVLIPNARGVYITGLYFKLWERYSICYNTESFFVHDMIDDKKKSIVLTGDEYPDHDFQDIPKLKKQINLLLTFQ